MTHSSVPAAKHKTHRAEAARAVPFTAAVLRAALISAGVGVGLLLLLCAVCLSAEDPSRLAPMLARGALVLSALVCGLLAAAFAGGRGLAAGAASGGILAALLWGLSLCLAGGGGGGWQSTLIGAGICVGCAAISGFLFTHRKPKKRKSPRRK